MNPKIWKMFNLFFCIILLHFHQTSYANQDNCNPSACGNIRNISYPFRLADDPKQCGDSRYQLVCESNTTFVYDGDSSHKYHVQAINYNNYTIRLADSTIEENNTCSFPKYFRSSITIRNDFFHKGPTYWGPYSFLNYQMKDLAQPVFLLSCQYPMNYSTYTKTDSCVDSFDAFTDKYIYIKAGKLRASDIGDMCTIKLFVMMSNLPFYEHYNISLSQIHESLLHGFDVSWYGVFCSEQCISGGYICKQNETGGAECDWLKCSSSNYRSKGLTDVIICQYGDTAELPLVKIINALINSVLWVAEHPTYFEITGIVYLSARTVIGVAFGLGLLIYKFRTRHSSMFDGIEEFLQKYNVIPIRYSYSEIKKMTKGFRYKLGEGGYGSVYKGKLRSGQDVAVKLLKCKSKENRSQDFMNEVATIGRIHHVNVVKLAGYCAQGSKRALVYDFMPNGSLDKHITSNSLTWEKKYEIAVGVARGIHYLHRGCDIQILHFDIKPHNILLDQKFCPKVSDFGLAKLYSTNHNTVTLTAARGTIGYVAPELINRSIGGVSHKSDVYSFGMLLMGMVGLNRDLVDNPQESNQYFPYWIYSHLEKWENIEIGKVDEIEHGVDDERITRKMTIIALWCIQISPSDRPPMSNVVEMLESQVKLKIPPLPSTLPRFEVTESQTWITDTSDSIA